MFWRSIISSFTLFTFWQVWLAPFVYTLTILAFNFAMRRRQAAVFDKLGGTVETPDSDTDAEHDMRIALAYLSPLSFPNLVAPLVPAVSAAIVVVYLFPILLGEQRSAPLSVFAERWADLLEATLVAALALFVVLLLPFVGHIVSQSPGAQTLIPAVVVFRSLFQPMASTIGLPRVGIFPSLWIALVYLLFAGVVVRRLPSPMWLPDQLIFRSFFQSLFDLIRRQVIEPLMALRGIVTAAAVVLLKKPKCIGWP